MFVILTISGPHSGHRNAISEIEKFITQHNIKGVIIKTHILEYDFEHSQDPKIFTLYNLCQNIQKYIDSVEFLRFPPDLIIYDFFSPEGLVISQFLNKPAICSIPAQIDQLFLDDQNRQEILENNLNKEQLETLVTTMENVDHKFGFKMEIPYLISDGYYFPPPPENIDGINNYSKKHQTIVWNYKTLLKNDSIFDPYAFLGSVMNINNSPEFINEKEKIIIYCSLGTIVPKSMFNLSSDNSNLQQLIINIYQQVIKGYLLILSDNPNLQLVINCPETIRDSFEAEIKEQIDVSDNIILENELNQTEVLNYCSLFITHGGGNSFQEAFSRKVPMIVLPFFGDQFKVGDLVMEHNLGKSFFLNQIKKGKIRSINDWLDPKLLNQALEDVKNLSQSIKEVYELVDYGIFRNKYQQLGQSIKDVEEQRSKYLWKIISSTFNPYKFFDRGDLMYGTTKDRQRLVSDWNISEHYQIGKKKDPDSVDMNPDGYANFDSLTIQYPVIIDQWNDILRSYTLQEICILRKSNTRIERIFQPLMSYRQFLVKSKLISHLIDSKMEVEGEELLNICGMAIDHFVCQKAHGIHLVIKDYYGPKNPGTELEIEYLRFYLDANPQMQNLFHYWKFDRLTNMWSYYYGIRGYLYFKEFSNFEETIEDEPIRIYYNSNYKKYLDNYAKLSKTIDQDLLAFDSHLWDHVWLQSRIKNSNSFKTKVLGRLISPNEITDIIGFRVIHPSSEYLMKLVNVFNCLTIIKNTLLKTIIKEKGNVVYLLGRTEDGVSYEIQFWTTILYTAFAMEHSTYYKYDYQEKYGGLDNPNFHLEYRELQHQKIMEEEHLLQKKIDSSSLWTHLNNITEE